MRPISSMATIFIIYIDPIQTIGINSINMSSDMHTLRMTGVYERTDEINERSCYLDVLDDDGTHTLHPNQYKTCCLVLLLGNNIKPPVDRLRTDKIWNWPVKSRVLGPGYVPAPASATKGMSLCPLPLHGTELFKFRSLYVSVFLLANSIVSFDDFIIKPTSGVLIPTPVGRISIMY